MGEAAHTFFSKVGTWITAILDTCDQRPFVVQRLAVALQIGNYFIQKDGLIRARRAAAQAVAEAARSTLRRSTWAKAVHCWLLLPCHLSAKLVLRRVELCNLLVWQLRGRGENAPRYLED